MIELIAEFLMAMELVYKSKVMSGSGVLQVIFSGHIGNIGCSSACNLYQYFKN
jgi:hypothetical protein